MLLQHRGKQAKSRDKREGKQHTVLFQIGKGKKNDIQSERNVAQRERNKQAETEKDYDPSDHSLADFNRHWPTRPDEAFKIPQDRNHAREHGYELRGCDGP